MIHMYRYHTLLNMFIKHAAHNFVMERDMARCMLHLRYRQRDIQVNRRHDRTFGRPRLLVAAARK